MTLEGSGGTRMSHCKSCLIPYGATTIMLEGTDNRGRLLYNNQTIDYHLEQKLNQALFPSIWK